MSIKKKGLGKGLDSLIPDNKSIKSVTPDKSAEAKKEAEEKGEEVKVLKLLLKGKSPKEAARELNISLEKIEKMTKLMGGDGELKW